MRIPRVVVVQPEPTPYRSPMFDLIAGRGHVDIRVVYAARSVASLPWDGLSSQDAITLHGLRVPGVRRLFRHDYPLTPGIFRALGRSRPDCVVVSGWSTFASQAAIAWCRIRHVPYVLLVESNDRDPRPGWRRAVKGAVVPRIVAGADHVLVVGSLARESMVTRGADPQRISIFANTIDVDDFSLRIDRMRERRGSIRAELGIAPEDVLVGCVARFVADKGIDTLLDAVARAGGPLRALVVGDGPLREGLESSSSARAARAIFVGNRDRETLLADYTAMDVFALLSRQEPWGVVVNEAAAAELPLVLSDRVGAAYDLLRPGENGFLVPVDDPHAAAEVFRALACDPIVRLEMGRRSRELVSATGYGPSLDAFERAVLEVTAR